MSTGTDAINVAAPVTATGGLCFADTTATLPTDAAEALDAAFTKAGFIGEDGVTRTVDASDDKIRAWGGDAVKVVRTEHGISYTGTFMESANAELLKLINGPENVVITPATADHGAQIKVYQTAKMPPRKAYVLDMIDGNAKIRELILNGQLTTSGDVTFVHSDVIRYEFTIETFPVTYEGKEGVKAISLLDDGITIPAGG